MKILITGDLVINQPYQISSINQNVIELFAKSDLNIVNLEAPVTSSTTKILKTGPNIKSHKESTLKVLKELNVDVVTLANNHVLDFGEQGVKDTLEFCRQNMFQTVGADNNLEKASKNLYIDSVEGKIAIVNFAENEWSSATENTAGANPMDIIDNAKQINEAKNQADFVFVIVHGGHEYYNLPSPRMQKQYRFYVEQGADIVIGHHTHCISGNEIYLGVPIYYSLGNFLFSSDSSHNDWYTGLILEVDINGGELTPRLYPVRQQKESFQLSLLEGKDKLNIFKRIDTYNHIIEDDLKLEEEWNIFIKSKYNSYLTYWSAISFIKNRYIRALFNKLGVNFTSKRGLALFYNLMRCEAHKDISEEVIGKYLK